VSRQFTDGEISAAIQRITNEGGTPSRTLVRKRLGGGSSGRIDALLKDYRRSGVDSSNGAPTGRHPEDASLLKASPDPNNRQTGGKPTGARIEAAPDEIDAREVVARLQSEIRVLKILLESERRARADDAARHLQTIEALQREIETSQGAPHVP